MKFSRELLEKQQTIDNILDANKKKHKLKKLKSIETANYGVSDQNLYKSYAELAAEQLLLPNSDDDVNQEKENLVEEHGSRSDQSKRKAEDEERKQKKKKKLTIEFAEQEEPLSVPVFSDKKKLKKHIAERGETPSVSLSSGKTKLKKTFAENDVNEPTTETPPIIMGKKKHLKRTFTDSSDSTSAEKPRKKDKLNVAATEHLSLEKSKYKKHIMATNHKKDILSESAHNSQSLPMKKKKKLNILVNPLPTPDQSSESNENDKTTVKNPFAKKKKAKKQQQQPTEIITSPADSKFSAIPQHGFAIRSAPTIKKQSSKKKLVIRERITTLPKPQWTTSGEFTVTNVPRSSEFISLSSSSTDFVVKNVNKKIKKEKFTTSNSSDSSASALQFKQKALFNDRIKRETSKQLLQMKEKQKVSKKF